jgi:hypothetical protein
MIRRNLKNIQKDSRAGKALAGKRVRIWCDERQGWWRQNGAGYTALPIEAGVWPFEEALETTYDLGKEKGIVFETIPRIFKPRALPLTAKDCIELLNQNGCWEAARDLERIVKVYTG